MVRSGGDPIEANVVEFGTSGGLSRKFPQESNADLIHESIMLTL